MNDLYTEILNSKKYSNTSPKALRRICDEAGMKYPKSKDALKAVKREIHIINDSYLLKDCHKKAFDIISSYSGDDISLDRDTALLLLNLHASSKERLENCDEIYSFLSEFIKEDAALGDIGCGFSPFAIPFWKALPEKYYAYEMNSETVSLLNSYFSHINPDYRAFELDAVSQTPDIQFDTVFLFKILPVLHQQQKGRAFSILEELEFRNAVVSFPLKSLSGKDRGMSEFYSDFFENGLPDNIKIREKTSIGNELFYVLEK